MAFDELLGTVESAALQNEIAHGGFYQDCQVAASCHRNADFAYVDIQNVLFFRLDAEPVLTLHQLVISADQVDDEFLWLFGENRGFTKNGADVQHP